jgi:hypothetical protein
MMTDNTCDLTCDICCINTTDARFSCGECKKSVCNTCYNNTRKEWSRDSGELGELKEQNDRFIFSLEKELYIKEVKTIEDQNYPIRCKYRCPYCRCDNYLNYDNLTKEDLLLFMKKDYLNCMDVKRQYHEHILRMVSMNDETEKLKKINEELVYCDGNTRNDRDNRLQQKIEWTEYQLEQSNRELVKLAKNFNTMMDILVNNNNIIKDKEQAVLELKNIRNKNKEIETIYTQKLQNIKNIIVGGNKQPRKVIERLKSAIDTPVYQQHTTISFNIEWG